MTAAQKFGGKYRGKVVDNVDPERCGRIRALVPDVAGSSPLPWAMPCVPMAGMQSGTYFVPPVGANVWVEFERGDPAWPVWVGGFWDSANEVPAQAQAANPVFPALVLQSGLQSGLSISDLPGSAGGIQLKSAGATIVVSEGGIAISNGKGATIVLDGPTVTINGEALAVT